MRARLPAMLLLAALMSLAFATSTPLAQAETLREPAPHATPPPPPPPMGRIGPREVTVANRSGLAIVEIYISPSSADAWGDDRLGEAFLAPAATVRLHLGRTRDCGFDILVIYEDLSREERVHQNLCRSRQASFDGKARIWPFGVAMQVREVVLANHSARAIQQVYVSAADAGDWGEDLLERAISVGDQGKVAYRGACTMDIRIVFENRSAEERRGVDLCRGAILAIRPGWTTTDDMPIPPA